MAPSSWTLNVIFLLLTISVTANPQVVCQPSGASQDTCTAIDPASLSSGKGDGPSPVLTAVVVLVVLGALAFASAFGIWLCHRRQLRPAVEPSEKNVWRDWSHMSDGETAAGYYPNLTPMPGQMALAQPSSAVVAPPGLTKLNKTTAPDATTAATEAAHRRTWLERGAGDVWAGGPSMPTRAYRQPTVADGAMTTRQQRTLSMRSSVYSTDDAVAAGPHVSSGFSKGEPGGVGAPSVW